MYVFMYVYVCVYVCEYAGVLPRSFVQADKATELPAAALACTSQGRNIMSYSIDQGTPQLAIRRSSREVHYGPDRITHPARLAGYVTW